MTTGRNRVTEAIEAWRALDQEQRNYVASIWETPSPDLVIDYYRDGCRAAIALLRAAAEPEANACDEEQASCEVCLRGYQLIDLMCGITVDGIGEGLRVCGSCIQSAFDDKAEVESSEPPEVLAAIEELGDDYDGRKR